MYCTNMKYENNTTVYLWPGNVYFKTSYYVWMRNLSWKQLMILDFRPILLGFLLLWLLNIWFNNLLSSEEMPNSPSVELISKWVEESVKYRICLCNNWKHLQGKRHTKKSKGLSCLTYYGKCDIKMIDSFHCLACGISHKNDDWNCN